MITAADDSFHGNDADPFWNESSWASIAVPERDLTGWVYFYHRPNMRYSVGGLALWEPGREHTFDCLAYNWGDTLPRDPDGDVFDFELANGFSVRPREPLRRYAYRFRDARCRLELEWTAFMEPVGSGLPEGDIQAWGSGGHYEQGGRMTGSIELDGQPLAIDCWSNRDRTWGPRTPAITPFPRGGTPWAIASETSAFQVFALAPDPDPITGATDRILRGWYLRDGEVGHLRSGTRRVERRPDGRPVRTLIEAIDSLGRELRAEGTCTNWLRWHGYPFLYEWWSGARWRFDGVEAIGEEQDFMPHDLYRTR